MEPIISSQSSAGPNFRLGIGKFYKLTLNGCWIESVSEGMACGHAFRAVPQGVEMDFIALNNCNITLSGRIIVEMGG